MSKVLLFVLVLVLIPLAVACGPTNTVQKNAIPAAISDLSSPPKLWVNVDGRPLFCINAGDATQESISCDWFAYDEGLNSAHGTP